MPSAIHVRHASISDQPLDLLRCSTFARAASCIRIWRTAVIVPRDSYLIRGCDLPTDRVVTDCKALHYLLRRQIL
jgi:hypothetical protein